MTNGQQLGGYQRGAGTPHQVPKYSAVMIDKNTTTLAHSILYSAEVNQLETQSIT